MRDVASPVQLHSCQVKLVGLPINLNFYETIAIVMILSPW